MSNIIKLNDEFQGDKDAAIMQMMSDSSAFPMLKESEVGVANYTPLSLSRLAAYGTAFQPSPAPLFRLHLREMSK